MHKRRRGGVGAKQTMPGCQTSDWTEGMTLGIRTNRRKQTEQARDVRSAQTRGVSAQDNGPGPSVTIPPGFPPHAALPLSQTAREAGLFLPITAGTLLRA